MSDGTTATRNQKGIDYYNKACLTGSFIGGCISQENVVNLKLVNLITFLTGIIEILIPLLYIYCIHVSKNVSFYM